MKLPLNRRTQRLSAHPGQLPASQPSKLKQRSPAEPQQMSPSS
jgi:hypothetical protein